jgi:hypothetical protein
LPQLPSSILLPWAGDPQPHYFSTLAVEEFAERAARK